MKRKTRMGIVLSAAVLGGSLLTGAAAEETFTHREWMGTVYTDPSGREVRGENVFGIGREAASVSLIPYQDEAAAQAAVWDYNAREDSEYFQLLTGAGQDWELTVVQNQEQAQPFLDGGFMNPGYHPDPADGWKTVELPGSWTMQGFDFPIYTNMEMPWQTQYDPDVQAPQAPVNYNPVGLYRRTFRVKEGLGGAGRHIYLNLQGVESAYYVYVNGAEVGYSEDSFSPHRFDVTDYVTEGENTLAVEVHKFCDGTWFEDQDMIYDGGIFREIYLTSAPEVQIRDYEVRTMLDESGEHAQLSLAVELAGGADTRQSGWSLAIRAYDPEGNDILNGEDIIIEETGSGEPKTIAWEQEVQAPKLWSAEKPNLYALVLVLKDETGAETEVLSAQLGFRELEFTAAQVDEAYRVTTKTWEPVRINGKRLLLKGTNYHDTDPFHGRAVPQIVLEEDLRMMKQNNLNAIRTSHYSKDDYFYWLCNSYGLYVIAETNLECHALAKDERASGLFYEAGMDRTETAYQRLKNHPSIVMWSIGNEMGYTSDPNDANGLFRDMIWYFKEHDPSRPVHSEGQGGSMGVDLGSNMYPSVERTWEMAGDGKMPYLLCEYVHSMGNSTGNLKEYWDAIRSADNMLGAFVWDWVDQSRATELPEDAQWDYYAQPDAHANLYQQEMAGKFFGYGGDWGDVPNSGSFCADGLLGPDRDPQPELTEVKYQYQNFWFAADAQELAEHQVRVFNESNFTDLNEYTVVWELLEDGVVIESGTVENAAAAPQTECALTVPFELPEKPEADYDLNLSVRQKEDTVWAKAGTEMSWQQIKLQDKEKLPGEESAGAVQVAEKADSWQITGTDFSFSIDKATGTMRDYSCRGEVLVLQGPTPNFWRGRLENDRRSFDTGWKHAVREIHAEQITVEKNEAGNPIITAELVFPGAGNAKEMVRYTVGGDGRVTVRMTVDARGSGMGNFLRIGSMLLLPEGFEEVTWYGNGPDETFCDRKSGARKRIWTNTVSGLFYPFLRADDTGSLTDVKWISVAGQDGRQALVVEAADTVEAGALHFTPYDLDAAAHVYELRSRKETVLSVNYGSLGTGGAACGPGPLEKYQLPSDRVYEWEFTIYAKTQQFM